MADFLTAHLYNVPKGREDALATFFSGPHVEALRRLRGFKSAQRFEICKAQMMDTIAQPWRYLSLYDFTFKDPAIDLPPLSPLLADIRDAGFIAADEAERIHSYQLYGPWKFSSNYRPGPFTHVQILLANFAPGREAEYHNWYEETHSVETSASPGYVGMRRGRLCPVQVAPVSYCPGSEFVYSGMQTNDVAGAIKEFQDRALGKSDPSVNWGPRSTAASHARTVHVFGSVAGPVTAS
jgi:hypothetical protein